MNRRDNLKVNAVTQVACLILVICIGLCCNAAVFAQVKDSFSKTEAWEGHGAGAKKITTETKFENGDVTVQTRYLGPKGKPVAEDSDTTKPTGETLHVIIDYDSNGEIARRAEFRRDTKGMTEFQLIEKYNNGVLQSGEAFYYDETGRVRSRREYDPTTQTYEEKQLTPQKTDIPSPKPPPKSSPKKASQDEAVS